MAPKIRIEVVVHGPNGGTHDEDLPEGWVGWDDERRNAYLHKREREWVFEYAGAAARVVDDRQGDNDVDAHHRSDHARAHRSTFELDETKARAFLHRALRRYDGTLPDGEGLSRDENWTLEPGWDTDNTVSDELSHIEDLVHQAVHVVGAITLTADAPIGPEGVDIELLIEAPQDGDWNYQWRVSLPISVPFALCSPYREDIRGLGWTDDIKAKGCRTAMGILREAVAAGNQILAAYTDANGRIPTDIA